MKKRFNFTDRKKIYRKLVQSTIEHVEDEVHLLVTVDFSTLQLPSDALVYIEYYLVGSGLHKKLYAGKVRDFTERRKFVLELPQDDRIVRGEFFVVDPRDAQILASMSGAVALGGGRDDEEARKTSPLPVQRTLHSNAELWRVDVTTEGYPILLIPD